MNKLLSELLISMTGGYFIGSLPIGPFIVYRMTKKDILEFGSKSAGATNVGRLLGVPYFLLVLLLDVTKSYLFLRIISLYCSDDSTVVSLGALALLVGNRCSVFLNAKGGKGVASSLGILLFLFSRFFVFSLCLVWMITLAMTKKIGIASALTAACCLGICIFYCITGHASYEYYLAIIASIHVLYCHTSHIMNFFYRN